jgi:cell fate (sporulation/competence/biofilm development) regulator YlbF (YheA/YmcA/DUF963 family)
MSEMAVETQEIMDAAEKLGQMVSQHPAVAKYRQAQKSVADDPDAARLMSDFDKQLETLLRQEQSGMAATDAQRKQLESLQMQIASHIKIKALNLAQVEFVDLLRKINQIIQRPLGAEAGGGGASGPRLAQ